MTSVPDHGQGSQQQQQQPQQQPPQLPQPDLRRLLAQHPASLRLVGPPSTPPPPPQQQQQQQQPQQQQSEQRYLPSAPPVGPPPCSPSPATPLVQACDPGDPYMRRDLPGGPQPPTPAAYYRLPPHVAAAYQAAYDCGGGGGGGNGGGGRSLPPVPGDYLPPHYHPHPHHSSYHYQTLSHHPAHHHAAHHRASPHHHHHHPAEFSSRRHTPTPPCGYLRHSSRSARLEELLSARGPSPRLPPTPSTPRATPPLQARSLPPTDGIENPMCEPRRRACYPTEPPRCYAETSSAPQRCYQQQQQPDPVPPPQPSRPDSRCSLSSNAGNNNNPGGGNNGPPSGASLPLSWRTAAAAAAVAQQQQQPCTPGTSPSGQATPASPSSSSSPSASATSSTSSASCSSSSCVSSSIASSVAQQTQASSPRAPSPPSPAPVAVIASSPIESTTADTPRVARAMTRTETIKNYIRRGTAEFFGLCDEGDDEERLRLRWLERRKRLAVRKCGALREECPPIAARHAPARQRAAQVASRPDVLPTDSPDHPGSSAGSEGDVAPRWAEPPVRRKESVARMALSGLGYVITTLTRHRPRATSRSREWSRSYSPATALDTTSRQQQQPQLRLAPFHEEVFFDKSASYSASEEPSEATTTEDVPPSISDSHSVGFRAGPEGFALPNVDETDHRMRGDTRSTFSTDRAASWRRSRQEAGGETTSSEVGASRIWSHVLDRALDNSDRRQYGMGLVGRLLRRSMRRSAVERHKRQLDDLEDYRPFFTYWVTTVHVMVMALSLLCYGLGPLGLDLNQRSGLVMVPSLSLQQVDYLEPANFWIGPRAADLIHLGAKFAPCMRKDHRIWRRISTAREKERETACCIRNDDSGCVQSSQAECSVQIRGLRPTTISTWKKWSAGDAGPGGRISGSVCGLDPKYCEAPASVAPYEWPDDITKWPICRKPSSVVQRRGVNGVGTQLRRDKTAEHMVCEVIAHPCCIGIHGACSITTREYCDFVRGKFHEEASLCSQVSCLDDVCGMIPFYTPDRPDQFYRLWTSLFLHAGLVHLLLTLVVQLCIMRDVERLTGPLRMAVIYLGSGMGGNLASAIFVPYRAEVGPAGAQFGLLACLVVEVLDVWPLLRRPEQALLKLLAVVALLLLLGLLPWVDNWAHIFGFVFGLLLSSALLPFVTLGSAPYSRHRKRVQIWACLGGAVALFLALVAIFYLVPVIECPLCDLFNCLPLTPQFCAEQDINFGRDEIV